MATCYHVVENASKLRVRGVNGDFSKTYSAKVVMSDRGNDLAIIKIDDPSFRSLPALPYSISSRQAEVGDNVFVVGYPLRAVMGDELKLTNGIVSSRTGFQGDATSYQLSATVQPGNSGGPLFNSTGSVVGVVNARLQVESATYAVKSPYLRTLIESMDTPPSLPQSSTIATLSLSEQVRKIRNYVYILEIQ
ncbi:MAG: trypsin-like peptidase domain-containing protein [Bacteroidales bacterium]|nr:trypsin-like peptidase domain-containing protein [Candidatus Colimorpha onthohippi]